MLGTDCNGTYQVGALYFANYRPMNAEGALKVMGQSWSYISHNSTDDLLSGILFFNDYQYSKKGNLQFSIMNGREH